MKTLIFDCDKSLATLGGPEVIEKRLGYLPVSVNGGITQLRDMINQVFTPKTVEVQHPIFGPTGSKEYVLEPTEASQDLECIVIDSLSVAGYQERMRMQAEAKVNTMDLQMWGLYGDRVMRFVHHLSRLPIPVIVTCHIDRAQDENGGPIEVPAIKGSAKMEMARFFDVIAYSRVQISKKGSSFSWQIVADGRRSQAKSRLAFPTETGIIEQNYAPVIEHYRENGITAPKIMVIGDSGHGKTYSFSTLVNI